MYTPILLKTHDSLLLGYNKSPILAEKLKEYNIKSCCINDYGSISGCMEFNREMKKQGIKPIFGVTLYICKKDPRINTLDNSIYSQLTILSKNLAGWKTLIKIVSASNSPDFWYKKPRISLDELKQFDLSNFICVSGGVGTVLADSAILNRKLFYNSPEPEQYLYEKYEEKLAAKYNELKEMFGGNLYISISLDDSSNLAANKLAEIYRKNLTNLVASPDCHYLTQEDAVDHHILLCSYTGKDQTNILGSVADFDQFTLGRFFHSDGYYLNKELDDRYTQEEIENTNKIADLCESYDITNKPTLPKFPCPNNFSQTDFLREQCRNGWKQKSAKIDKMRHAEYGDRIKYELSVIEKNDFSGYFLIISDIIDFCRKNKWLTGPSRGSVGGCLVAYLAGITGLDSIKYNLLFERFINPDRKKLPDIDFDVPKLHRKEVIDYIKEKYGHDKVYQICAFQTMKGRGILKEILRATGGISFELMNKITKHIPDEAKISDELEEMRQEGEEDSIVLWALKNKIEELREWCFLNEEGKLEGPFSKKFEQAIRMEGTKKSQGKHASAVVISASDFSDWCHLVYDEGEEWVMAGLDMKHIEDSGLVKIDCLGLSTLDRIMSVNRILKEDE